MEGIILAGKHTSLRDQKHGAWPVAAVSGVVECRLADGVLGVDSHKVGIAEARNCKDLSLVRGHMQCCQLQAGVTSATHTWGAGACSHHLALPE